MKRALAATLTVRLPMPTLERVKARARSLGVTPSKLLRASVERELARPAGGADLYARTRRFIGAVQGARRTAGRDARRDLERWDPDRRG